MNTYEDAYEEGYEAFYNKLTRWDNPYAHGSLQADEWYNGWWCASLNSIDTEDCDYGGYTDTW